jgi:hypothetical protein
MTNMLAAEQRRQCMPGTDSDNIDIDPEFRSWMVPLSESELALLHQRLDAEGCRDALIVWKHEGRYLLVDGHDRIAYCRARGIPFWVVEKEFADRAAVRAEILQQQAGRRNLSAVAASYYRGRLYREMRHQGRKDPTSGHCDQKQTSELLAQTYKVGEKTIRRDAELAAAVDKIVANCGEKIEVRNLLLSRDSGLKRGGILQLAELAVGEQQDFIAKLEKDKKPPRKARQVKGGTMTVPLEPQALLLALLEQLADEALDVVTQGLVEAREKRAGATTAGENGVSEGETTESDAGAANGRRGGRGRRGSRNSDREAVGAGMMLE